MEQRPNYRNEFLTSKLMIGCYISWIISSILMYPLLGMPCVLAMWITVGFFAVLFARFWLVSRQAGINYWQKWIEEQQAEKSDVKLALNVAFITSMTAMPVTIGMFFTIIHDVSPGAAYAMLVFSFLLTMAWSWNSWQPTGAETK